MTTGTAEDVKQVKLKPLGVISHTWWVTNTFCAPAGLVSIPLYVPVLAEVLLLQDQVMVGIS